ncbi:MAG TPA: protease HtpX [Candidatus Cloacimonadota bacterium]|nr:protease HtpX [Candidatus Cloacimonadota bacterium]HPS38103.1 protease HtpX [Candidatus Cloacimonadota bacterium]
MALGAFKRLGLFLLTNFLVVMTLTIIMSILGIRIADYSGLLVLCAVFGFAGSLISLLLSKTIAKWSYKIQLIDRSNATGRYLNLFEAIEQMAAHLGIKTPQVGIYPSADINAFATGATANGALIAFSSAIIERLDDPELAAVAGHELSHVTNGDMVTMTLLTGVANTFVMFFARIIASMISNRDNEGGGLGYMGYFLIVMVLENILMLLAYIPISAFSRWREFGADGGAAQLTGPMPMITALQKIDRNYRPETKKDSFAMAKISSRNRVSLFATHPSIEARIERLQKLL